MYLSTPRFTALVCSVLLLTLLLGPQQPVYSQETQAESGSAELTQLKKVLPPKQASRLLEQLDRFRTGIGKGDQEQVLLSLAEEFKAFGQNPTVSKNIVLPQFLKQFSANPAPSLRILSVSGSPKALVLIIGGQDFKLELNFDSDFKIERFEQVKTDPKNGQANGKMGQQQSGDAVGGLVQVTHTGPTSWKIRYQLTKPVRSIFFGPKAEPYFGQSWKLPEEFKFSIEGPYAYLERRDGAEFREVEVPFETYPHVVPYAPQPFMVFDSGTAINTYSLGLASRMGEDKQMRNFEPDFQFIGYEDEVVLIPTKQPGSDDTIPFPEQGLFVFFGNRGGIIQTEEIVSVLDSDLPLELVGPYLRATNQFAQLYNDELGRAHPGKLNMLVSFERNDEMKRLGFAGGAQGDAIAAKISDKPGSATNDPQSIQRMQLFFAHEMGHVWQQKLGQDDARWFNEGEADILSLTACARTGAITTRQIATDLTDRIQPCLEAIKQTRLMDCHMNGFPQANYDGGGLAIAAAVAATGADGVQNNVFDLDVELKKFPTEELREKPLQTFFAALRKLGATQTACDSIDEFITKKHDAPQQALIKMLDATGLDYSIENDQITIEPTFAEGMFPVGSEGPAHN